jgi:hypothetical protein
MQINIHAKPQRITSDLDYQICELQKEFEKLMLIYKTAESYTTKKPKKPKGLTIKEFLRINKL